MADSAAPPQRFLTSFSRAIEAAAVEHFSAISTTKQSRIGFKGDRHHVKNHGRRSAHEVRGAAQKHSSSPGIGTDTFSACSSFSTTATTPRRYLPDSTA